MVYCVSRGGGVDLLLMKTCFPMGIGSRTFYPVICPQAAGRFHAMATMNNAAMNTGTQNLFDLVLLDPLNLADTGITGPCNISFSKN